MDLSSFNLESFAIDSGGIPRAYYIPEFISEDEEAYLLRQIYNAPKPKWKTLGSRRLQVWGKSRPYSTYREVRLKWIIWASSSLGGDLTSNKLFAQPLSPFLTDYPNIIGRLKSTGAFDNSKHGAPNHVIINEYLPLQGIMPHEDGPSYHPVVATISLQSHTAFHYYRYKPDTSTNNSDGSPEATQAEGTTVVNKNRDSRGRVIDMSHPVLSLLLEPRSLVITTRELYTDHLHGIDPLAEDVFAPASSSSDFSSSDRNISGNPDEQNNTEDGASSEGVRVANWRMIRDPRLREVVTRGGTLNRDARVSLTCRDVESVVNVKTLKK